MTGPEPTPAGTRRKRWIQLAQLGVTLAILWFLLRHTTLDELRRLVDNLAPGYFVASAVLTVVTALVGAAALLALFSIGDPSGWRWQFALDYLYVQALCQLTPAQMGEAALPYMAGRGRFQPGQIAAALVVQRMSALLIVVTVAVLGAGRWAPPIYLWGAAGAVLAACALLALLITLDSVRAWINLQVGRRFGPVLAGFYDAWKGMVRQRPARLLAHVGLMLVRYALAVAGTYTVLSAFSIQPPFSDLAALSALAILASLAPITINGVGITEGVFVIALGSFGYGAEPVLAACLCGRLVTALVLALCMLFSVAWTGLRGGEASLAPREP